MNIYMANKEHGGVGREDRDTERDLLKYNCTLKQRMLRHQSLQNCRAMTQQKPTSRTLKIPFKKRF